jgi:hypothetical protein
MFSIRSIFNRWVIAGAVIFACILFFVFTLSVILLRTEVKLEAPATAELVVIPATSGVRASAVPTLVSVVTDQDFPTSNLDPDEIGVGAYVKVAGTGGEGLRLRDKPGLEGNVRLLGGETEVFIVNEGPLEVDGYTWWYLVGSYDENREGWAAADYLSIVDNP